MRNLILIIGVFVFTSTLFTGKAIAQESEIKNSLEAKWELVKEESNIQIYFLEYRIDDISYLKIRFNNASGVIKNFSWSLLKDNNLIIENYNTQIPLNNFFEFFSEESLIEIDKEGSIKDFSIIINIK